MIILKLITTIIFHKYMKSLLIKTFFVFQSHRRLFSGDKDWFFLLSWFSSCRDFLIALDFSLDFLLRTLLFLICTTVDQAAATTSSSDHTMDAETRQKQARQIMINVIDKIENTYTMIVVLVSTGETSLSVLFIMTLSLKKRISV